MVHRIVTLLQARKNGLSFHSMAQAMNLPHHQKNFLRDKLSELEDQGIVVKLQKKYFLRPRSKIIRGRLITARRGYGFVRPEGGVFEDVFIPARFSGGAYLGDLVEISCQESREGGKLEGRVLRILESKRRSLLGVYKEDRGGPSLLPFDSLSSEEVPLKAGRLSARPGMIVRADRETGMLESILGFPDDPGVDTEAVIQRFGLESSFSKAVLDEADSLSESITPGEIAARRDFRSQTTLTIDDPDARDFDDAVGVETLKGGGFRLGVHIADVSHYVSPGSSLDMEAFNRGTSVYFPDRTLPMFPEKLSNRVCSLRPREDKLTVSVLMDFDGEGHLLDADFRTSVIRTSERMTYESVFRIFEGDKEKKQEHRELVEPLIIMRDLARRLRLRRFQEGSLDFDLAQPELVYVSGGLRDVKSQERNEAQEVIEEFMVAANETVATFLVDQEIPVVFRSHPPPAEKSLSRLRDLLKSFAISLPAAEKVTSQDLQRILQEVEGRPEEKFVTFQVLKSLRLAVYSVDNPGHYGLAKKNYVHFTSPIRRYPDLIIHRLLKQALLGAESPGVDLAPLAAHCSDRERHAEAAERELMNWRIFRLLKSRLGDEFLGIITGVTKAGLVVELVDYFVEGFISFSDLPGTAFRARPHSPPVGRKRGRSFGLGDQIRVILVSIDPFQRRMIFVPSGDAGGSPHSRT